MNAPVVAAVDWGTSSFRIWLLDAQGRVLAERRSDEGMSSAGGAAGYPPILERHLAALQAAADLPVLVCGMAGARQGWVEAPYVALPAGLAAMSAGAVTVPGQARQIRILPGLAQRDAQVPDVMRGEETQLAGIAPLFSSGSHLICMPGTHSKWVQARDGVIVGFRTWLTGELFALLSRQSILRHSLGEGAAAATADDPAFAEACSEALELGGDIGSSLFRIRAGALLNDLEPDEAAARLSGLLIGAEIASVRRTFGHGDDEVILVASGRLGALYAGALGLAGLMIEPADADEAVRAGLAAAARQMGWLEDAAP